MPLSGKDSRNLTLTYITGFLDVVNYSLIIPILPYIVDEMKATDMESGILYSGYSFMQLISTVCFPLFILGLLIVGALSDIYGRKIFLILSLFGSCFGICLEMSSLVGSLFQALSTNITQLIIFRSITGLFAGSNILVQAFSFHSPLICSVIADLTVPEERNRYYSCLEALNSAGFILGPALGAILAKKGTHFPLFVAGLVSGIALVFALFLLHETSKDVILLNEMRAKARKASGSSLPAVLF